ncbi:MAG: DUF2924 domain-containing protein [Pseudomonadota bacterium]
MSLGAEVEREVVALGDLSRKALVERWAEAYGAPPAADVSPALMRKALAWEVQAQAFGGHSAKTLRTLKAVVNGKTAPKTAVAGTRIVREWNGATYEVEVLESGYRWRGETWTSLSAIAQEITGTKWSGPRFFGLVNRS